MVKVVLEEQVETEVPEEVFIFLFTRMQVIFNLNLPFTILVEVVVMEAMVATVAKQVSHLKDKQPPMRVLKATTVQVDTAVQTAMFFKLLLNHLTSNIKI
ncbi:MAG: hypothetical protein IPG07_16870 [Crocinitomicaceae bacterium]|nr:hypothetical protein [Crocinitomicaceae bacterium]